MFEIQPKRLFSLGSFPYYFFWLNGILLRTYRTLSELKPSPRSRTATKDHFFDHVRGSSASYDFSEKPYSESVEETESDGAKISISKKSWNGLHPGQQGFIFGRRCAVQALNLDVPISWTNFNLSLSTGIVKLAYQFKNINLKKTFGAFFLFLN